MRSLVWTFVLTASCISPGFDGTYRVASYTLNKSSCTEPGEAIDRGYSRFKIDERQFGGVSIYPVYPCLEGAACQTDNDEVWSLVVIERDLDNVEISYAQTEGNTCLLRSEDKTIEAGADGGVVLRSKSMRLTLAPYDPTTCTTDNAKAMRPSMTCGAMMELVGARE